MSRRWPGHQPDVLAELNDYVVGLIDEMEPQQVRTSRARWRRRRGRLIEDSTRTSNRRPREMEPTTAPRRGSARLPEESAGRLMQRDLCGCRALEGRQVTTPAAETIYRTTSGSFRRFARPPSGRNLQTFDDPCTRGVLGSARSGRANNRSSGRLDQEDVARDPEICARVRAVVDGNGRWSNDHRRPPDPPITGRASEDVLLLAGVGTRRYQRANPRTVRRRLFW